MLIQSNHVIIHYYYSKKYKFNWLIYTKSNNHDLYIYMFMGFLEMKDIF